MADDSKNRPSMEPMHPSVQWGSSMSAMGVPKPSSSASYSHMVRPQPSVLSMSVMTFTRAAYSSCRGLPLSS